MYIAFKVPTKDYAMIRPDSVRFSVSHPGQKEKDHLCLAYGL